MEDFKEIFIKFLLSTGALKIDGDFKLKSGRLSPYFVNIGDFNDGGSTSKLGNAYAFTIKSSGIDFDIMYGIPEKGISLAVASSVELARLGINKPWFFIRKEAKNYGEAINFSKADKRKTMIVGRMPKDGDKIILLDDVLTTAETKHEAIATLESLVNDLKIPALFIAVDRQEVGFDGKSAIQEFTKKTGIPVFPILTSSEILQYLRGRSDLSQAHVERIARYLRAYGTDQARESLGEPLEQIIVRQDRSVIPACDVPTLEKFEELVKATADLDKIGGYKIGFELALAYGLGKVVETARKHTDKPLIYDHQKAGTDIPDTGKNFARVCKNAGVDAVILFPQAGPETERSWIYHALDQELKVIVGGRMTHPAYSVSEGGFVTDEGALEMYRIAAKAGVDSFVVPGNKPDVIKTIKELVEAEGVKPVFFAPGFVAQGGKIEDATKVAGNRWHAIVGRGIYEASDMRKAAEEHTSQI